MVLDLQGTPRLISRDAKDSPGFLRKLWTPQKVRTPCCSLRLLLLSTAACLLAYYGYISSSHPSLEQIKAREDPLLDDVIGCEEAKRKVSSFVTLLQKPHLMQRLGLKHVPGLIFYGPDGTGKRMLSMAVAREAGGRFVEIDMERLLASDFADAQATLRELFDGVADDTPTVIFVRKADLAIPLSYRSPFKKDYLTTSSSLTIDDIWNFRESHAFSKDQSNSGSEQNTRLLHALFSSYERASTAPGGRTLLLIISTNHKLGRTFNSMETFEQVSFHNPDKRARELLFSSKLKDLNVKDGDEMTMLSTQLARATPGLNGRDISRICTRAALLSLQRDLVEIQVADIEEAVKEVQQDKPVLSDWERKTVAYHEAGHAVVSWMLEHADEMLTVSIVPDNDGALGFTQYNNKGSVLHTNEQVFAKMCVALAGRFSEQHFLKRLTTGARDDLQKVTALAYFSSAMYGFNENNISFEDLASFRRIYGDNMANTLDSDVQTLIAKAAKVARKMVYDHKDKVEKVASTLLDKDSLSFSDMVEILGPSSCKSYDDVAMRSGSFPRSVAV